MMCGICGIFTFNQAAGQADRQRGGGIGRASGGRIVLIAAVTRRIVGRGNHHTIRQSFGSALIIGEDGMRNHRGRGITDALLDHNFHAVGRKHLDRRI